MNEGYQDIVTTFSPEKSPEGDAIILRFQPRSGEVLRFRLSDAIARNFGTRSLLLSAISGDR